MLIGLSTSSAFGWTQNYESEKFVAKIQCQNNLPAGDYENVCTYKSWAKPKHIGQGKPDMLMDKGWFSRGHEDYCGGVHRMKFIEGGRSFYDDYGATFAAWGARNVLDETVSNALAEALSDHPNAAYRASGKDWYVISYREAGYIVYEKYFISAGFINGWSFKYPASRASVMNPVCSAVARTFKPGWKNPYWDPDTP